MSENTTQDSTAATSQDEHTDFEPGEQIVQHPQKDGAVAGRVSNVEPGAETNSVSVNRRDLLSAIWSDLKDSYDSVFLWSDGETIAVTDHERPIGDADVGHLADADVSVDVKRVEDIRTPDSATVALLTREHAADALTELDADRVTVHVDSARPVVVEHDGQGVAIAPCVKPTVSRGGEASV